MTRSPITILVVDDHPIFRRGLIQTIQEQPDFKVCAEAGDADAAVELAVRDRPDIILLDLSMPGGGLNALANIRDAGVQSRIIVLTASEDSDNVATALKTGAHAYLLKGVDAETLASVIHGVLKGEGYVPPQLAARVIAAGQKPHDPLASLTDTETRILRLVARGDSNKQIARELAIEEKTVKNHLTRIFRKLNLRNRTEAALAIQAVPGN